MLIKTNKKQTKKIASYRLDSELLDEFKALCKKNSFVQVHILENAMRQAISEMKSLEIKNGSK